MDRIAVVTGCSGGIGCETAKKLIGKGYKVYGLSRTKGDSGAIHIPTDVTNEKSVADAFAQIEAESGGIDVLINNAGCGISGAIEFTRTEDAKRQMDVNFFGMFLCSKYAIPLMRKKGSGRIVNVSSVAAVFSIPFQAFYSASKFAINALTLAMRNELGPFDITVTAVQPGDVKTGFTGSRAKSHEGDNVYGGAINASVAVMEKDEQNGMTPEYVAGKVVKAALKKRVRPLYTIGFLYKLYYAAGRVLPLSIVNFIVGKLYIKHA